MAEEAEIVIKSRVDGGQATIDTVKKINAELKNTGDAAASTDKQTSSLTSTLQKLAAIVGVTALANQFKTLVKGSLDAAGAMEQVDIALTTMLGSGEKAKKLTTDLIAFAKKTPFEIEGIFSSTKQLLAYGVAQEEIISTMSTLGNIAAGVGVDMNRLALAYGQVKTTGHLMGQDLNQFTQAGVPLLAALAQSLGKTEAEVLKMKESGEISFDAVKAALESMTAEGGRFFNLMENQSKTFLGTVSNMSDSFYQVKVALGDALLPVAKEVVASMISWFGDLKTIIENNKASITAFAKGFVEAINIIIIPFRILGSVVSAFFTGLSAFVGSVGGKFVLFLTAGAALTYGLIAGLIKLPMAIAAVRAAFLALSAAMLANPFTAVAIGISALITAGGYLVKNWDSVKTAILIANLYIEKSFASLKTVIFDFVESVLDKLSVLSGLPMFGWVDDAKKKFGSLKDSAIADIEKINDEIKNIKSKVNVQSATLEAPAATTQTVKQNLLAAEDPVKAEQKRLKALKAENDALLDAQKNFLAGYGLNESEADRMLADNKTMRLQQQLLQSKEFQDKKLELDQQLIDQEISLDTYKTSLDQLNTQAKNDALQTQYDAESAKLAEHKAAMFALESEMDASDNQIKNEQLQAQYTIEENLAAESATRMAQFKAQQTQQTFEQKKAAEIKSMESTLKMDSDTYKAAQGAANELVALQNSKNKQLAAIGKAAAIFQITNDTARGAMSAYASLAGIPIVGPGLGAAAAAAVIAYGAERIASTAQSFAVGAAEIPQDQLANIHAGEMIIPATFAESIRAGDLTLGSNDQQPTDTTAQGAPVVNVINVGSGETQGLDIGNQAQDAVAKAEQDNAAILEKNAEFLAAKQAQETAFNEANPSALNTPIDQKIAQIDASNQAELNGLAAKNASELSLKTAQDAALLKQKIANDKAQQDQDKKNEDIRRAMVEDRQKFDFAQLQQASKDQAKSALTSIQNDAAAGAQAAYRAMASIPYVGPVLGAAAAAQVMAYSQARKSEVNSFAVGTASVPQDQLAQIHKNEMIVPATFSQAILAGDLQLSGGKNKPVSQNDTSNITINFSFAESNFVENRDDFISELAKRMSQLINENVIPAIPTRTAA